MTEELAWGIYRPDLDAHEYVGPYGRVIITHKEMIEASDIRALIRERLSGPKLEHNLNSLLES